MPGQMTTELRCRAMLSLQQLYTPENLVFFVRGVRVEARGKSRYKLISLTFQETLLSSPLPLPPSPPLSAPHPHLPQAFSPLTPGHEWTRLAQRGVRNSTRATTHGSDNDTTRTLLQSLYGGPVNKNPDTLTVFRAQLFFSLPPPPPPPLFSFSCIGPDPLHKILLILSEKTGLFLKINH